MRECTNCRVKFDSGRCPKCRSYQYVREASNTSTGSTYAYETYTPSDDSSWGYSTGDSDNGSSNNDSCSDSSSSGGDCSSD